MSMVMRMTANPLNNRFYLLIVHGVEDILLFTLDKYHNSQTFFNYETLDSHFFALTSHLWMLADTCFMLISIFFITCNILDTLFESFMIPIYTKKSRGHWPGNPVPVSGYRLEKKKDTLTTSTQNIKLSTLDYNMGSENCIRSSTAPREAIKHQKVDISTYSFCIWTLFNIVSCEPMLFAMHQQSHIHSLYQQTI